jgi:hypothetical protein
MNMATAGWAVVYGERKDKRLVLSRMALVGWDDEGRPMVADHYSGRLYPADSYVDDKTSRIVGVEAPEKEVPQKGYEEVVDELFKDLPKDTDVMMVLKS